MRLILPTMRLLLRSMRLILHLKMQLAAADKVTTFKMVVRTIAKRYGLHATFMPKPLQEMNGSGMHLNMQLYKDGRNVFEGEDGNLSRRVKPSWPESVSILTESLLS